MRTGSAATASAATDVLIVGGGVMGAATACFLAREHGARVTVLERDPSYARASSALSASSIRQQFSTPINIALSQGSLAFYRNIGQELAVDDEAPDIGLVLPGYLYLATAAGADTLRANHAVQREAGAPIELLAPAALAARFPWLEVTDIALGSHGPGVEGWFDGYSVLAAFRRKAIALGVHFAAAQVTGWERSGARVTAALDDRGQRWQAGAFVIAAGAWSAPLAAALDVTLPVRARKRDVFVFSSPAVLPDCPLVIDPSGFWFRPDGRHFICGAPPRGEDRDDLPLDDVDLGLFDEVIWPALAQRVPQFNALRLLRAWAGYYEMNTFDHNGVVGALPGWDNAFTACGFSGHGMQHAPAVGRALAERIALGRHKTLDLSSLGSGRITEGRPLLERNVI